MFGQSIWKKQSICATFQKFAILIKSARKQSNEFAHLYPDSAKVKEGDIVKAGDELAGVGTTGYSTGPHLHYQVQLNGSNVDGMSLIDFSDKTPPFNPNYPGFDSGGMYNPNFPMRP